MRKSRTFHTAVVALVLATVALLAGCDAQQGMPADETPSTSTAPLAKCAVQGFEDMSTEDPKCGKLVWKSRSDDLSIREEQLLGRTIRYYLYDEVFSENWQLRGQLSPGIHPYRFTQVRVIRLLDRDIVAIEVSETCAVSLWEKDESYNLGCGRRGLQHFTEITASDASVVYAPQAVAWMTKVAENAGRTITFAISCLTQDPEQPDGSPYTGLPGCPTA